MSLLIAIIFSDLGHPIMKRGSQELEENMVGNIANQTAPSCNPKQPMFVIKGFKFVFIMILIALVPICSTHY